MCCLTFSPGGVTLSFPRSVFGAGPTPFWQTPIPGGSLVLGGAVKGHIWSHAGALGRLWRHFGHKERPRSAWDLILYDLLILMG